MALSYDRDTIEGLIGDPNPDFDLEQIDDYYTIRDSENGFNWDVL